MDVFLGKHGVISFGMKHKPGDPPPSGYLDWHEWADVQQKAGLRQRRCGKCHRWKFPQEMSGPKCLGCAHPVPEHDLGGEG